MDIIFVKHRNYVVGSDYELGDNLSRELTRYTNSYSLSLNAFTTLYKTTEITNSIIIFVKAIAIDESVIKKLSTCNKLYFFMVDKYRLTNKTKEIICGEFCGMIFSNSAQMVEFSVDDKHHNLTYYHHWSPSLLTHYARNNNRNKLASYFGAKKNFSLLLHGLVEYSFDFDEYKGKLQDYKFHVSYRDHDHHGLFKPCVKLSTCSFADSVFICTRDSVFCELLPRDYPYFLGYHKDQRSLLTELNPLLESVDSKEYQYSLQIMKKIRRDLNIENTARCLFDNLTSHLSKPNFCDILEHDARRNCPTA